jgi:hypothetical protein
MNLFSAGPLDLRGREELKRLSAKRSGTHPPALYEKASRGVSNNILKKAKGKSKKAQARPQTLLIKVSLRLFGQPPGL